MAERKVGGGMGVWQNDGKKGVSVEWMPTPQDFCQVWQNYGYVKQDGDIKELRKGSGIIRREGSKNGFLMLLVWVLFGISGVSFYYY